MTKLLNLATGALTLGILLLLALVPAGVFILGLWLWRRAERRA